MQNKIFLIVLSVLFTSVQSFAMKKLPQEVKYRNELKQYHTPKRIKQDTVLSTPLDSNGVLTLAYALNMTSLYNFKIRTSAWEIEGKQGMIFQNRLLDNPSVESEFENFGIDEITFNLSQNIPLGGKLISAIQMAKIEHRKAIFNYQVLRLTTLVELSKQFVQTIKYKEKLKLMDELYQISVESYNTAIERKKAGVGSNIDVIQTQKELEMLNLKRSKDFNKYLVQLNILSSYWGNRTNNYTNIQGNLEIPLRIPAMKDLQSHIAESPTVSAWVLNHEMLLKKKNMIVSQVIPDLDVLAGYKRNNATSENSFLLGVSLELPLWNFKQGEIKEAKINIHKSKYEKQNIENEFYKKLLVTYNDFSSIFQELNLLKTQILPLIQKTYSEGRRLYRNGVISLTELLIYQNELINIQENILDLSAEFFSLKYDLELLTGFEIKLSYKE